MEMEKSLKPWSQMNWSTISPLQKRFLLIKFQIELNMQSLAQEGNDYVNEELKVVPLRGEFNVQIQSIHRTISYGIFQFIHSF
jgi:hypothetical protein